MEIYHKVYKVVKRWKGHFCSAVVYSEQEPFFTEYRIGTTSTPKIGKFLAFVRLEDAHDFIRKRRRTGWGGFVVLECETSHFESIGELINVRLGHEFERFWSGETTFQRTPVPTGTVACNDLKPIREVG